MRLRRGGAIRSRTPPPPPPPPALAPRRRPGRWPAPSPPRAKEPRDAALEAAGGGLAREGVARAIRLRSCLRSAGCAARAAGLGTRSPFAPGAGSSRRSPACSPGAGGAPRSAAEPAGAPGTCVCRAPPSSPRGGRAAPRPPRFAHAAAKVSAGSAAEGTRPAPASPGAADTLQGPPHGLDPSQPHVSSCPDWELRCASMAFALGSKVLVVWSPLFFFPKRLSPGSRRRAWLDSPAHGLHCVRPGSSLAPAGPSPPGSRGRSWPPGCPPTDPAPRVLSPCPAPDFLSRLQSRGRNACARGLWGRSRSGPGSQRSLVLGAQVRGEMRGLSAKGSGSQVSPRPYVVVGPFGSGPAGR